MLNALGYQKLASARSAAVARFDPRTLIIELQNPFGDQLTHVNAWEAVAANPVSILAHELTHFFQMTSTAYGLKRMAMYLEGLTAKLLLLRILVEVGDGGLRGPVLPQAVKLAKTQPKLMEALLLVLGIRAREFQQDGGTQVDASDLEHMVQTVGNVVYQTPTGSDLTLGGFRHPPTVDLRPLNGPERLTTLGAWQVMEGAALAIQLVQARVAGLEGELRAGPAPLTIPPSPQLTEAVEPYFVTNRIYSTVMASRRRLFRRSCLEELFVLSDLALMHDPLIDAWDREAPQAQQEDAIRKYTRMDAGPGNAFLYYLGTLAANERRLSRLGIGWTKEQALRLQNSIRSLAGEERSVTDTVDACIRFLPTVFGLARKTWTLHMSTLDVLEAAYANAFRFRRDVLGGGPIIEDLLTSKEKVVRLMRGAVPGVIIGHQMISRERMPGHGIAVDLMTLSAVGELLDSILYGGAACPIASLPRRCVAPICDLCQGAGLLRPAGLAERPSNCQRDDALRFILAATSAKAIRLSEP